MIIYYGEDSLQKIWRIKSGTENNKKSIIERILENRGIFSQKKKEDFLTPLNMTFTSPYVFNDMTKCVERISQAVEKQEKIVIWGDFDADGVTSTCLLYKTLKQIGANVEYYIPSRQEESHGLNSAGIIKFLNKKAKLFITVDCGSTSNKEANFIKSFGADLIITDHHETGEELPNCYAIINPKSQNNLDENLPIEQIEYLTNLAGVGVAFKLALALIEKFDKKEIKDELLVLVTLGTIADIVPLIGENRAFVKMGLALIKKGINKGIDILLKSINYTYEITSDCIAFYIAPRINASGRLADAQVAFDLLYENDEEKLKECAKLLNDYNTIRQKTCDETFSDAIDMIKQNKNFQDESAIVLYKSDWHIGVIGIVASKLIETFYKPAFLMCNKEEHIICSSRGIEETDIHEIILSINDLIESGGGHKMAGGFVFNPEKVEFSEIKSKICDAVKNMTEDVELKPSLNIDLELLPEELNLQLAKDIKELEPFGTGNPVPLFCCKNLEMISSRLMGQNNNHLKIQFRKDNENYTDAVFWNRDKLINAKDNLTDAVFYLKLNEFNGEEKVQLDLRDLKYEENEKGTTKELQNGNSKKIKFIDQRNKENIYELLEDYCKDNNDNIKIYAYKKETLEKISKFKNLEKNIISKAQKINQLVFFNIPKSAKNMEIILEKTNPEIVHIAIKDTKIFSFEDYLKTLSGLLKYILNKKAGIINFSDLSNYFSYDEKIIKTSIELFSQANVVEFQGDNLTKINTVELSKLKVFDNYKFLEKDIDKTNDFLTTVLNSSVENIKEFLKN